MTTTSWDDFAANLAALKDTAANTEAMIFKAGLDIDALCGLFLSIGELEKTLKLHRKLVEGRLLEGVPASAGTHGHLTDKYRVTVDINERTTWNADTLAEIFQTNAGGWPAYLGEKLTVDKRLYDKASAEDKALVNPAKSVSLQAPKIEVTAL